MRRYAIVIEVGNPHCGAYVPDLPGCVAVGDTPAEVARRIRRAIELHLEGLAEDGQPIPEPSSRIKYVEVGP